jgi:uncharacterized protein YqgC (DUF456 family)
MAVLIVCSLAGIASLVVTSSGTLLVLFGALLYGVLTGFADVTAGTLAWAGAIYLSGEALEYVVTMATVQRLGGSWWGAIGAAVGAFFGAVLGFGALGIGVLPGTLLGLFAGGFAAEWLATRDVRRSARRNALNHTSWQGEARG